MPAGSSNGSGHSEMAGFNSPHPRGSFVTDTIEMARRYYRLPGNSVGGALHVVLDDGNLHPSHVAWCRDNAVAHAQDWGSTDPALAMTIAERMLQMSETQRRVMVARLHSDSFRTETPAPYA